VEGTSFRLADEVRYIQRRAADHDGRIVAIGQLVLFSTDTGDAWLLDRSDRLAARLARNGETRTSAHRGDRYRVHDRLEGQLSPRRAGVRLPDQETGRVVTILGYPTDKLTENA